MTEKEKKAYERRSEKRVRDGRLIKFLGHDEQSAWQLEGVLREDADEWKGDFFGMFLRTPELQEYYKANKAFLDDLFRNAFMYGGCYFAQVLQERMRWKIASFYSYKEE